MRLRANFRQLENRFSEEVEVHLLCALINSAHRYYLEEGLRSLNIPNRTRIYKAFGWSYNYQDREDMQVRHENQLRFVESILQNSTLLDWVEKYCRDYTLHNFLNVAMNAKADLSGLDIHIEAHRDE